MIPLLFSCLMHLREGPIWQASFGVPWLLFLPNAPYIITDLIHLRTFQGAPVWLDVLLLTSFAGTGLIIGYASVRQVHALLDRWGQALAAWIFICGVFFLIGFGIYLGRFLRWRSWDLISNPFGLLSEVVERIVNPLAHPRAWGFTIAFGAFLFLGYLLLSTFREPSSNREAAV